MKSGDFDSTEGTWKASFTRDAAANDIISFSFVLKHGGDAAGKRARLTATLMTPVRVEEESSDCQTCIVLQML